MIIRKLHTKLVNSNVKNSKSNWTHLSIMQTKKKKQQIKLVMIEQKKKKKMKQKQQAINLQTKHNIK